MMKLAIPKYVLIISEHVCKILPENYCITAGISFMKLAAVLNPTFLATKFGIMGLFR